MNVKNWHSLLLKYKGKWRSYPGLKVQMTILIILPDRIKKCNLVSPIQLSIKARVYALDFLNNQFFSWD